MALFVPILFYFQTLFVFISVPNNLLIFLYTACIPSLLSLSFMIIYIYSSIFLMIVRVFITVVRSFVLISLSGF